MEPKYQSKTSQRKQNHKKIFFINPNYNLHRLTDLAWYWNLIEIYYMDRPLLVALLLLI